MAILQVLHWFAATGSMYKYREEVCARLTFILQHFDHFVMGEDERILQHLRAFFFQENKSAEILDQNVATDPKNLENNDSPYKKGDKKS